MSTAYTISKTELIQMKVYHEDMLNIINKKLQEQEKTVGVSTSTARKGSGPIPAEQVQRSINKRRIRMQERHFKAQTKKSTE